MEFERRRHRHAPGNIAPLVDVVFLLLLFFVLTYQATLDSAITVELPPSSTAREAPQEGLVLSIDAEGSYFLNDSPTTTAGLRAVLTSRHAEDPDLDLTIRADKKLDVGALVQAVDLVRESGVMSFSLATTD